MNEINDFVVGSEATMPRMGGVRAVDANTILVNWIEGARSGRTEAINLSPLLDSYKAYTPLRRNKPLFATVHIIDNGNAIAWGDDNAIDMPATSIERLAEEAMTSDDFYEFMKRNHLTHDAAASVLGRS